MRRIAPPDVHPGIVAQLLEPKRHAIAFAVETKDLDFQFLANANHFRRMLDAPPGHVGDVQQAVDASEIHESAVLGEVLDHALDHLAFLQAGQQRRAFGAVQFLDHRAAGHHHVVAPPVQLDDLEVQLAAFQVGGVADRMHVHQGTGQECPNIGNIDRESALDAPAYGALHDFFLFERRLQAFPDARSLGALA